MGTNNYGWPTPHDASSAHRTYTPNPNSTIGYPPATHNASGGYSATPTTATPIATYSPHLPATPSSALSPVNLALRKRVLHSYDGPSTPIDAAAPDPPANSNFSSSSVDGAWASVGRGVVDSASSPLWDDNSASRRTFRDKGVSTGTWLCIAMFALLFVAGMYALTHLRHEAGLARSGGVPLGSLTGVDRSSDSPSPHHTLESLREAHTQQRNQQSERTNEKRTKTTTTTTTTPTNRDEARLAAEAEALDRAAGERILAQRAADAAAAKARERQNANQPPSDPNPVELHASIDSGGSSVPPPVVSPRPVSPSPPPTRPRSLSASHIDDLTHSSAVADAGQHATEVHAKRGDESTHGSTHPIANEMMDEFHALANTNDLHASITSPTPSSSSSPVSSSRSSSSPKFHFTSLAASSISSCIGAASGTHTFVIVGNSLARGFYFQLLNLLITAHNQNATTPQQQQQLQPTTRPEQKKMCAETLMRNHDRLHELNGGNLFTSCPSVFEHIKYYYVSEFYDPVLEHIFASQPDHLLLIGIGMLDVLDSSTALTKAHAHTVSPDDLTIDAYRPEWRDMFEHKKGDLSMMLRSYTHDPSHTLVVFSLPPVCTTKYLHDHEDDLSITQIGTSLISRIGKETKAFNQMLQELTLDNGGNWFALHSYVPTSREQNARQPKRKASSNSNTRRVVSSSSPGIGGVTVQILPGGSSICSLYEDGLHPGVLLRKLVVNNLFNLMCKTFNTNEQTTGQQQATTEPNDQHRRRGWSHSRYDQYTHGTVELIDEQLKRLDAHAPMPLSLPLSPLAFQPTLELTSFTPADARRCLNTVYGVDSKKPIVFVGSSDARALYFTFINRMLEHYPGVATFAESSNQANTICEEKPQTDVTKATLRPSCPPVTKPPVHNLVHFIQQADGAIWDPVLTAVFESEPAAIIHMAPLSPPPRRSVDGDVSALGHAIRNYVLLGGGFIELLRPPVCESRPPRGGPNNRDAAEQNQRLQRIVATAGGSIIETASFISGIDASDASSWRDAMLGTSNGCSQYEDRIHSNLEVRKEVTNALWNLLCQNDIRKPFIHRKGDRMHIDESKTQGGTSTHAKDDTPRANR